MRSLEITILALARTGGVAGIRPLAKVLNLAEATANVADRAVRLLEEAHFFSLPAELPRRTKSADAFQYVLTAISADGRSHSVAFEEADASEALRELKRLVRDASV